MTEDSDNTDDCVIVKQEPGVSNGGHSAAPSELSKLSLSKSCMICEVTRPSRQMKCVNNRVLLCDACRSFFRDTVKQGKTMTCVRGSGDCKITAENRARCQLCRYMKGVKVGMPVTGVNVGVFAQEGLSEVPNPASSNQQGANCTNESAQKGPSEVPKPAASSRQQEVKKRTPRRSQANTQDSPAQNCLLKRLLSGKEADSEPLGKRKRPVIIKDTNSDSDEHSDPDAEEWVEERAPCAVCTTHSTSHSFRGVRVPLCIACYTFFRKLKPENAFSCVKGQGNCDVTHRNKIVCKYCRYAKGVQNGIPHIMKFDLGVVPKNPDASHVKIISVQHVPSGGTSANSTPRQTQPKPLAQACIRMTTRPTNSFKTPTPKHTTPGVIRPIIKYPEIVKPNMHTLLNVAYSQVKVARGELHPEMLTKSLVSDPSGTKRRPCVQFLYDIGMDMVQKQFGDVLKPVPTVTKITSQAGTNGLSEAEPSVQQDTNSSSIVAEKDNQESEKGVDKDEQNNDTTENQTAAEKNGNVEEDMDVSKKQSSSESTEKSEKNNDSVETQPSVQTDKDIVREKDNQQSTGQGQKRTSFTDIDDEMNEPTTSILSPQGHKRIKEDPDELAEKQCDTRFSQVYEATVKSHNCPTCEFKSDSKFALFVHLQRGHITCGGVGLKGNPVRWNCAFCPEFATHIPISFTAHMKEVHSLHSLFEAVPLRYRCGCCNFQTNIPRTLLNHEGNCPAKQNNKSLLSPNEVDCNLLFRNENLNAAPFYGTLNSNTKHAAVRPTWTPAQPALSRSPRAVNYSQAASTRSPQSSARSPQASTSRVQTTAIRCEMCETLVPNEIALFKHLESKHNVTTSSTTVRAFVCRDCKRQFYSSRGLFIHRQGIQDLCSQERICPECNYSIPIDELIAHFKKIHARQLPVYMGSAHCLVCDNPSSEIILDMAAHLEDEHKVRFCELCNELCPGDHVKHMEERHLKPCRVRLRRMGGVGSKRRTRSEVDSDSESSGDESETGNTDTDLPADYPRSSIKIEISDDEDGGA